MTLNEMINGVRRECNMALALGRADDHEIVGHLNYAQRLLGLKIIEADQKYFEIYESIAFVASQEEYDIPRYFKDQRVALVERYNSSGDYLFDVSPVRLQDKERHSQRTVGIDDAAQVYYLRGRKIGFKPKPPETLSAAIRIYGIQAPHEMHYASFAGSVGANLDSTLFKMAGGTMLGGTVITESDYYKNAIVRVITGTGRGVERTISAFNAATQIATVDSGWTAGDLVNCNYVILSRIPEDYHEAMVSYAVAKIARKSKDRQLYAGAREGWLEIYATLSDTIQSRNIDQSERVQPPVDELDDFVG